MSETNQQTQQIPEPPRPLTPRGARRAWGDQRVRFWWLCALALAVIMVGVAVDRVSVAMNERSLIAKGTVVIATVEGMDGSIRAGWTLPRTDSHDVKLRVKMADGRNLDLAGTLPPGPGVLQIGQKLPIKIDPNHPSHWTDQTQAISWTAHMVIPMFMFPFVVLLVIIAWYRRRHVLTVWRDGQWMQGVVVELRQSAMAPLSRVVRYNIPDVDKRIFSVLMPMRIGIPQVGEPIDLVLLPRAPQRAVVAKLYL